MTLDQEDIDAIVSAVCLSLNKSGEDDIRSDDAMRILGIRSKRALFNIARKYPEIKPGGKGAHIYSRAACLRLAAVRKKRVSA